MNSLFDWLRPASRAPREPAPLPVNETPPRALRNLHFMNERPSAPAALLPAPAALPLAAAGTARR